MLCMPIVAGSTLGVVDNVLELNSIGGDVKPPIMVSFAPTPSPLPPPTNTNRVFSLRGKSYSTFIVLASLLMCASILLFCIFSHCLKSKFGRMDNQNRFLASLLRSEEERLAEEEMRLRAEAIEKKKREVKMKRKRRRLIAEALLRDYVMVVEKGDLEVGGGHKCGENDDEEKYKDLIEENDKNSDRSCGSGSVGYDDSVTRSVNKADDIEFGKQKMVSRSQIFSIRDVNQEGLGVQESKEATMSDDEESRGLSQNMAKKEEALDMTKIGTGPSSLSHLAPSFELEDNSGTPQEEEEEMFQDEVVETNNKDDNKKPFSGKKLLSFQRKDSKHGNSSRSSSSIIRNRSDHNCSKNIETKVSDDNKNNNIILIDIDNSREEDLYLKLPSRASRITSAFSAFSALSSSEQEQRISEIKNYDDATEEVSCSKNRYVEAYCAICLGSYEVGDGVVWSPNPSCEHVFHEDCILTWFSRGKRRCPCCRLIFVESLKDKKLEDLLTLQIDTNGDSNNDNDFASREPEQHQDAAENNASDDDEDDDDDDNFVVLDDDGDVIFVDRECVDGNAINTLHDSSSSTVVGNGSSRGRRLAIELGDSSNRRRRNVPFDLTPEEQQNQEGKLEADTTL